MTINDLDFFWRKPKIETVNCDIIEYNRWLSFNNNILIGLQTVIIHGHWQSINIKWLIDLCCVSWKSLDS
jgi:hypothetical protein